MSNNDVRKTSVLDYVENVIRNNGQAVTISDTDWFTGYESYFYDVAEDVVSIDLNLPLLPFHIDGVQRHLTIRPEFFQRIDKRAWSSYKSVFKIRKTDHDLEIENRAEGRGRDDRHNDGENGLNMIDHDASSEEDNDDDSSFMFEEDNQAFKVSNELYVNGAIAALFNDSDASEYDSDPYGFCENRKQKLEETLRAVSDVYGLPFYTPVIAEDNTIDFKVPAGSKRKYIERGQQRRRILFKAVKKIMKQDTREYIDLHVAGGFYPESLDDMDKKEKMDAIKAAQVVLQYTNYWDGMRIGERMGWEIDYTPATFCNNEVNFDAARSGDNTSAGSLDHQDLKSQYTHNGQEIKRKKAYLDENIKKNMYFGIATHVIL